MDENSDIPYGGWGRKRTVHTTRRVWTFGEECKLMCALNDLVVKGYKCDNGFKSGYLLLLKNMLAIKFPGTDFKGEPHINSKIHVWKRQYVCLKKLLGISGVGLNSTTFHVEVILGVCDAQYKVDPFTKSLRNRAFPFYAQWGKQHCSTMDMDEDGESLTGSKRKYGEGIEVQFLDTMGNFCDASNTNFGQIAETMGHIAKHVGSEYDNRMRREHVYDALGCMDFITVEARVDVAGYLCNNSKDMDLFFSLPDEEKNVMVTRTMRKLAGGG
ncbi:hypothetical protein ACS0TY_006013 [Phlomoides rotata]